MKTKLILSAVGIAALAFLVGRMTTSSPAPGGSDSRPQAPSSSPQTWTCSMHPQIQQPEPGDCPICGMDLIPLEEEGDESSGPREMSMSEASRALADIQTTEIVQSYPEAEIRLVGKLDYDETKVKSLSARFPARIDELFVNFTGIRVNKGEHLAKVYSPELLTAQRELLSAHRADPNGSITRAAREKLRLWDLLPSQIEAIIESGEAKDHFVLKAPIGGVVVEKHVKEGDYVKTGEPLFRIVDLSVLWAELDAYESDLPWLRFGQDVSFNVESFPGETFHGQIVFIEPEVDRKTRTVPIRVNVPNGDQRLKPGMFVRAVVASRLAEDGKVYAPEFAGKWISPMHPEVVKDHPGQCDVCGMDLVPAEELGYVDNESEPAPLVVPASAVLRTGKRAVVYVQKPDTQRPTYEGREITLGPRAGDVYLVASGLEAGERVVTQGAFKIDSALQIQAKPSMMNPEEAANGQSDAESEDAPPPAVTVSKEELQKLLPDYLKLQKALAADELDTSKQALKAMMKVTGHEGPAAELIHKMMNAGDLESIRRPHFESLSDAIIAVSRENPSLVPENLMIMHCPMVYDDRGADWLQTSEPLNNPYFGASMLRCGEIKERIHEKPETHQEHNH
ncbi:efflux transporter periplasmic adaptor subunit [Coraliomargarita sinensis]|uniref:Efflux transporter periplasmic adaptor subunit n=1 Tax=Coraliomargarita sinensis TaxID=2174842 RepID=A0A317ZCT8_9BACT|nr:efflux RND transporter periplasmic adaptor subunit [Coraliomargarita sinensis]PXA03014.1 efflux transporter periplasmic adaptor subunit [Coraliomargarita sinensis]